MSAYPPPYNGGYAQYPESSQADLAIILASLGGVFVVIGFCCGPLLLLAVPLLIGAGWIGHNEVSAIDAGRRDPRKRQTAEVAKWLGIIGAGALIAITAVLILFVGGSLFLGEVNAR